MSVKDTWFGMRQRCNNPNNPHWKNYGGRGISVQWKSFNEFFADVGQRPPGLTLDRIDNDGDYAPGNVRWATRAEQQKNRRNPVFVEIGGKSYRALDLVQKSGMSHDIIKDRARRGLSLTQVLSPEKLYNLSGLALGGKAFGAKMQARTHCKSGHEYTHENTLVTKEGWRRCRTCHCIKMRRLNAKKK
jgi:hypothetical protein